MAVKWIKTNYPGVRYYEHPDRLYRGKKDRNFAIRYKKNGKTKEEGLGWASSGMNAQKANRSRAEIVQNIKEGKSPQSLAEKRQIEAERIKAENEKRDREQKAQITFGGVADEYLKWAKNNKKSYKSDESRYNNHLLWLSEVSLKDISPLMLERLKRDLKAKDLSDATIHQVLALIRAIYRKSVTWRLYDGQIPTEGIKFPKIENKRLKFLSHEEADQLLKAIKEKSKQVYNQSLLALFCGLRFSEIAKFTWEDVDLPNGIIQIRDAKEGSRQSYITEPIKEMLEALHDNKKHRKNDLIFPDLKGERQKQISRTFYEVIKELKFNQGVTDNRYNVSFHTLRHSFASWLAIQGTSLYEIKELLGHKSIEMTERYAYLLPDVKRKAVNRLAETFKDHVEKSEPEKKTQPEAVKVD
jgi:integrase